MGKNQTENRNAINDRSLPQVMPNCATSLEDDFLLKIQFAEQLSSNNDLPFTCNGTEITYCANREIMVICTPNKALVGFVNCSAQHWEEVSATNITVMHLVCCMLRF